MREKRDQWITAAIFLVYMLVVTAPYLYAWLAAGEGHVFGGLLINPLDGNSYLAKMRQGYDGSWSMKLPYSAEPGEGSFIMLFYLLLGHISAGFLAPTYHLFRLLGALCLLLALDKLCRMVFPQGRAYQLALMLAAFGSGLGWLAILFGQFTSDLWVVEAFPFLAGYATPHFAFGLALQTWLLCSLVEEKNNRQHYLLLALGGLALSLISPFAIVVIAAVGVAWLVWKLARREAWQLVFARLAVIGLASAPAMFYDLWVSQTHPVLKLWHMQNLTLSPPWWDLLLSLSPALLLAIWGVCLAFKGDREISKLLAFWMIVSLLLVYIPFSLQRRFLHGLYIPLALLAVLPLANLHNRRIKRLAGGGLLVFSLFTNLVVLLSAVYGIRTLDSALYLTRGEYAAFEWISYYSVPDLLTLAAPDTGQFIPVYTSERVLYGHPFETVNAEEMKALVTGFYEGSVPAEEIFSKYPVAFVFYGPREQKLGRSDWLTGKEPCYESDGVQLYSVNP